MPPHRGGIDLGEPVEDVRHAILRNADAGVADRKVQQRVRPRRRVALHAHQHVALGRELHGIAHEVDQDLTDATRVADEMPGDCRGDPDDEIESLLPSRAREQLAHLLDRDHEVEGHRLQPQAPGLDLREVEDVVDDGHERVRGLPGRCAE